MHSCKEKKNEGKEKWDYISERISRFTPTFRAESRDRESRVTRNHEDSRTKNHEQKESRVSDATARRRCSSLTFLVAPRQEVCALSGIPMPHRRLNIVFCIALSCFDEFFGRATVLNSAEIIRKLSRFHEGNFLSWGRYRDCDNSRLRAQNPWVYIIKEAGLQLCRELPTRQFYRYVIILYGIILG